MPLPLPLPSAPLGVLGGDGQAETALTLMSDLRHALEHACAAYGYAMARGPSTSAWPSILGNT